MKQNEQKLDEIFHDKLESIEVLPPASVWDGIQQKLINQKSKKEIILFRVITVAAVVVIALIAGWLLDFNSTSPIQPVSEIKVKESPAKPAETLIIPSETTISKEIVATNQMNNSDVSRFKINKPSGLTPSKNENLNGSRETLNSTFWFSNIEYQLIAGIKGFISESEIVEKLRIRTEYRKDETSNLTKIEKELIALNSKNFSATSGKTNNWEVGFRVSPGYSSQRADHAENYSRDMTYSNTKGNADLSGGVSLGYKSSKRWSVESGIYYSQNGQSSGNSMQSFSKNDEALYGLSAADYFNTPVTIKKGQMAMNSTAGVIQFSKTPNNAELLANLDGQSNFSNALLTTGEFSQVFDFIEVPLYLRYNLIDQKINIDLVGGLSANWVVGNNVYMNTGNVKENIGKTTDISTLNYSGTVGIGIAYTMSKRISISMEPRFNYYLNSINKNEAVNYHPYRIGIYTGINYEF